MPQEFTTQPPSASPTVVLTTDSPTILVTDLPTTTGHTDEEVGAATNTGTIAVYFWGAAAITVSAAGIYALVKAQQPSYFLG